ncbi:DUF3108 domain-containing protein [Pseudidiomarina insulisalsae]|uniref:DUF3108 domain-containing protein n=1 Tax=Pseudidiomarina insulisalsae TaxID=575789 RepID=A0A432YI69_9GAMM|nr:DUF3108 domain-containing protein [Pseudidiomarina insulisalsae]RUO60628.1 DUF3108 domain-containing protein [Pseudidiomarina insulisalsae]
MKAVVQWLSFVMLSIALGQSQQALALSEQELSEYYTRYQVQRGGSDYGEATRQLQRNDDGSFLLQNETEISFLFLSDVRRYESVFSFAQQQIKPQSFSFKRSGTGSNKKFAVQFDPQAQQVIEAESGAPLPIQWQPHLLDEASMLEQLRFDLQHTDKREFDYQLVGDKGDYDEQKFRRLERETLSLPYGEVEAIKVERVRTSSTRETLYWFAPQLDYVMVKMQQRKEGDEVATLLLEQVELSASGQ